MGDGERLDRDRDLGLVWEEGGEGAEAFGGQRCRRRRKPHCLYEA